MSKLDDWTALVAIELDLATRLDRSLVLDLARDVARSVARPAAPLTTYLLGVAVGAGANPEEAAELIRDLAEGWEGDDKPPDETTLGD